MPGKISLKNRDAAIADLNLTDEEVNIYQHHLNELSAGGVSNPDGSISTFRSISVTDDQGYTHVIPTVWDSEILDAAAAVEKAKKTKAFPKYKSIKEAEDRYNAIHHYMELDLADYLNK